MMLLEVAVEMIIPLLMASIIDEGVQMGDMDHIKRMGGWMLLMAVVGLVTGILGGKFGAHASAGLAKNLRQAMYENIQTFSFSNIDKFSTAGLITRLTTDVTNIQNAYMMILRMCTRAPASMIVAMIMAFVISPRLASIYLVAVIALGIVLFLIMSKAMVYFRQVFRKYDDLNASVQENVSAIRVVKAYVREDHEESKFRKAAQNIYKMFLSSEKIISWTFPAMNFTVYACILLISWLGAHAIVGSTLTTGNLTSLLTYCLNILMSLMMLSMVFVMISMSIASAERVAEVLTEKADLVNPENPVYEVADGSVEFRHVDFAYNKTAEKPVLKDINFTIKPGETIGILGGTGSAKTSLVNLVSRLYDVTGGEVLVGGRNVKEYDLDTLRNQVSVVLQKNVLFSGTILENLRWGDENATEEECRRACRLACADEFIEKMPDGYHTYIEQGGSNVSGGQKQRLCIARALLKKPKVLILDDSTSAVDTATDAKIRQAMAEEIPGTTKFIIAQRVSSVQHADRILVLDDGAISGFDTHEKLLESNEIYRDVYESQTNGNGDFDEGGEQ
jgi:ATP-binding cassette subfamily B protein